MLVREFTKKRATTKMTKNTNIKSFAKTEGKTEPCTNTELVTSNEKLDPEDINLIRNALLNHFLFKELPLEIL